MANVEIIAVPPGQAPEWVRKAWVGLVLPLNMEEVVGFTTGIFGGKPQNTPGYLVSGEVAIGLLEKENPTAAAWWHENAPWVLENSLVFKQEVCRLIV